MNNNLREANEMEFFRGNEFNPGVVETREGVEVPIKREPAHNASVEETSRSAVDEEREERLNLWMNDIKAFIRNIDVKNL